jgi:hypothetical protein
MKGRVTRCGASLLCAVTAIGLACGCARGRDTAPRKRSASAPAGVAAASIPDATRAASDPDELERAFATSRRALGAGRLHARSKLSVAGDESDAPEELDEEALVERGANGDVHARYENSRDQAREIVQAAGMIWLRPGFGKFHRRAQVDPGEAERVAADIGGVLAADFDLVAAQVAVSDGGTKTIGGRSARRVVLALGPARERPAHGGTRAWRDGVNVEVLAGLVDVDDLTGTVLGGHLEARVAFMQNGRKKIMTLSASEEMVDLGGAVAIAAPDEANSVKTPGRAPDFEDREELLSGLAPSARRGGIVRP